MASKGFYCNSRLYEMAVDDNATLTQKICLANDLKDRRDPGYAKALLFHIFPSIPRSDYVAILRSDALKDWFASNPTGLWCSQDDKTFMHITVKNYICDNSQNGFSSLGCLIAEDGTSSTRTFEFHDRLLDIIETWRGDSLEKLGEILPSEYGSGSIISGLPKPIDNSISPFDWELPTTSDSLERAKAENLKVQRNDEDLLQNSQKGNRSKDSQGEKCQDNDEDFEGLKIEEALSGMNLEGPEKIEEALSGMHLNSPSRALSKQNINADSSRAHKAFIVHTQQIRNMESQFVAGTHAHKSGNALMTACRKVKEAKPMQYLYRPPGRRASHAKNRPSNPPVKGDTGRIGKQARRTRIEKIAARKLMRELNCDRDVHELRLNSSLDLPKNRMNRICNRLEDILKTGAKVPWTIEEMEALLRIANTQLDRNKSGQTIPKVFSTVKADSRSRPARKKRGSKDANAEPEAQHMTTSDIMETESLDIGRETEWMDTA